MAALAVTMMIPASATLFASTAETAPAAVATFAKNGTVGDTFTFTTGDFVVENTDQALDSIILTSLPDPSSGILTMGNNELAVGDVVGMSAVAGLRFHPLIEPTIATTSFSFTPVFADGSAGNDCSVGLYLLTAENSAPIARNLELSTYKNVSISEQFSATDPEGDLITYRLVNKPARGAVVMPEEGATEFVYTPYENKTGKDSFTYVAVDAVGNTSAPATVSIKIEKAATKVTYADMDGVGAHRDAIRLAEKGILIGENMGGTYFFQPEQAMSRDQFVALAMNTVGVDALEGITRTGFSDDAAIPTWAKPYVSSALKSGLVQGTTSESGVVFNASNTITKAEAAVLLNRMLQVSDAAVTTMFTDSEYAPAWAYQAAVNLETVGVLRTNSDGSLGLGDGLTRADAAEMLSGALDVLEARQTNGWFKW
ncbi:MAG: S-layer homology domain-containing protein [Clostridia bacterium]|nr:S-layer homology domain-containing protein [Clostridia bacterium]